MRLVVSTFVSAWLQVVLSLLLGVLTGMLSAMFGVGGAVVSTPGIRALGATPLKPERSTNFSGGFTMTPLQGFTASIDYYSIGISNRIVLSSNFATASVAAFLAAGGNPGIEGGRYFTNGIDTRTEGLDVTGSYSFRLTNGDKLNFSGGYNYNDTRVTFAKATPANVLALTSGTVIFDRQSTLRYERGTPLDKAARAALARLESTSSRAVSSWLSASSTSVNVIEPAR